MVIESGYCSIKLKINFIHAYLFILGFYRSKYMDGDKETYLGVTQFESTGARKAFPCMDEPERKAYFNVKLGRPSNMIAR